MKKTLLVLSTSVLAAIVLAACGQSAEPAASAVDATSTAAATTPAAEVPAPPVEQVPVSTVIWADPLPVCGGGQVATINWSKEAIVGGPGRIVMGETATPPLFALVGNEGSKETGAWAAPGMKFVLRGDDGAERARLVLAGPANCP